MLIERFASSETSQALGALASPSSDSQASAVFLRPDSCDSCSGPSPGGWPRAWDCAGATVFALSGTSWASAAPASRSSERQVWAIASHLGSCRLWSGPSPGCWPKAWGTTGVIVFASSGTSQASAALASPSSERQLSTVASRLESCSSFSGLSAGSCSRVWDSAGATLAEVFASSGTSQASAAPASSSSISQASATFSRPVSCRCNEVTSCSGSWISEPDSWSGAWDSAGAMLASGCTSSGSSQASPSLTEPRSDGPASVRAEGASSASTRVGSSGSVGGVCSGGLVGLAEDGGNGWDSGISAGCHDALGDSLAMVEGQTAGPGGTPDAEC